MANMASTTLLLWTLAVILLAGTTLVFLGWRGRRLHNHPTCRDCGFDVSATFPASPTCPECGAGLNRRRGVRIGNRRKGWLALAPGLLLVIAAIGTGGALAWVSLAGVQLSKHAPTGLLVWQLRAAPHAEAPAIGQELLARMLKPGVAEAHYHAVVKYALDAQGDRDRPWDPIWADLVDRARLDGHLPDADLARFRAQTLVLKARTRPRVAAGGLVPIVFDVVEARTFRGEDASARAVVHAASIAGRELTRAKAPHESYPYSYERLGAGWVHSRQLRFPSRVGDEASVLLLLPTDAPQGPQTIALAVETQFRDPGGTGAGADPGAAPIREALRQLKLTTEVLPRESAVIQRVDPTPELESRLRTSVRLSVYYTEHYRTGSEARQGYSLNVQLGPVPADLPTLVGALFVAVGPEEPPDWVLAGTVVASNKFGASPTGGQDERVYPKRPEPPFRVRFVPDLAAAEPWLNVDSVYAGEIVFTNVPVDWTTRSRSVASDIRGLLEPPPPPTDHTVGPPTPPP